MLNPASKIAKKPNFWVKLNLHPLVWVALGVAVIILMVLGIGETGMTGPKTVDVGSGQANSLVELRTGNHLRVTLDGNPTTGYNWEVSQVDSQVLKQVGDVQFQADSSAVGSGGKIIVEFEAVGTGTTNLQMIYHRSWETGTPPLQTFAITVKVGN